MIAHAVEFVLERVHRNIVYCYRRFNTQLHHTPAPNNGDYESMPLNLANKPQVMGILVLCIGVALLAFTFINAFIFLHVPIGIIASGDLARVFGDALAPLIQACIHLMYLGIMGWIGSLLTLRGIPLVTHKYVPVTETLSTPTPLQPQKTTVNATPEHQDIANQAATELKPEVEVNQSPGTQLIAEPRQEEPKAILVPPETQREE